MPSFHDVHCSLVVVLVVLVFSYLFICTALDGRRAHGSESVSDCAISIGVLSSVEFPAVPDWLTQSGHCRRMVCRLPVFPDCPIGWCSLCFFLGSGPLPTDRLYVSTDRIVFFATICSGDVLRSCVKPSRKRQCIFVAKKDNPIS